MNESSLLREGRYRQCTPVHRLEEQYLFMSFIHSRSRSDLQAESIHSCRSSSVSSDENSGMELVKSITLAEEFFGRRVDGSYLAATSKVGAALLVSA